MKIRTGFVSNSSSSNFILSFEKVPENMEELHVMLFGDEEEKFLNEYGFNNKTFSTKLIAQTVFNDIFNTNRNLSFEDVVGRLITGSVDDDDVIDSTPWPDQQESDLIRQEAHKAGKDVYSDEPWNTQYREANNKEWSRYEDERLETAKRTAMRFYNANRKGHLFAVEYSDNDGLGCQIEHGGTFQNIPHIRISHH